MLTEGYLEIPLRPEDSTLKICNDRGDICPASLHAQCCTERQQR